jgi:hypothetical protein
MKQIKGNEIQGNLDIFIAKDEDGQEILIHGDPKGLKSFAKLLLEIANLNQEEIKDKYLPIGTREHYHLRPGIELSKSSDLVILGRLDAKGTGKFFDRFISKKSV